MTTAFTSLSHVSSAAGALAALALLTHFVRRLHAEGIRYCLWKSNEHLGAALGGTGDLDVLVHRKDARRFTRLLTDADFKPFRKLSGHDYPGIEDYLGFDADTGRLSHLHVHYQLSLGEKFLKGYRLPWEDVALATRILDAEHGLYVIDPPLEALLLVIRAALKLRARDYLLAAVGYRYFRGGAARELRWLARRVDADSLRAVAQPLVGARATVLLTAIMATASPSIRQLVAFRRSVRPALRGYRMYGPLGALGRRWAREARWIWVVITNRLRGLTQRSTRAAVQGGLTVCVSGPQPEATAVARQLVAWLAPEVAVVPALGAVSPRDRQARGRGLVVIADRVPKGSAAPAQPDVIIPLGGGPTLVTHLTPANTLLQAKRAIWANL